MQKNVAPYLGPSTSYSMIVEKVEGRDTHKYFRFKTNTVIVSPDRTHKTNEGALVDDHD